MAVLTNCYILAMASNKLNALVPTHFQEYLESDYGRLMAMLALEHVLFGAKVVMMSIIDDMPRQVQEALARQRVELKQKETQERVEKYRRESTVAVDADNEGMIFYCVWPVELHIVYSDSVMCYNSCAIAMVNNGPYFVFGRV